MTSTTTFINFVPSKVPPAPFFNATLDGSIYTITILWNLFAQRYYVQVQSLDGTIILYTALVGSPIGIDVSALSWANGTVTVTTITPHQIPIGQIVNVSLVGAIPDAYNGLVEALVINMTQFTFALATNPGAATTFGTIQQNIDLVAGLLNDTLVYRGANMQFEVTNFS